MSNSNARRSPITLIQIQGGQWPVMCMRPLPPSQTIRLQTKKESKSNSQFNSPPNLWKWTQHTTQEEYTLYSHQILINPHSNWVSQHFFLFYIYMYMYMYITSIFFFLTFKILELFFFVLLLNILRHIMHLKLLENYSETLILKLCPKKFPLFGRPKYTRGFSSSPICHLFAKSISHWKKHLPSFLFQLGRAKFSLYI